MKIVKAFGPNLAFCALASAFIATFAALGRAGAGRGRRDALRAALGRGVRPPSGSWWVLASMAGRSRRHKSRRVVLDRGSDLVFRCFPES